MDTILSKRGARSILITFQPMSRAEAEHIVTWTYPDEYSIYSFNHSLAEMEELLNGDCFSAFDERGEIVGFVCHNQSAQVPGGFEAGIYETENVVDIGLGLRPDLTGQGLGLPFLHNTLRFFSQRTQTTAFRLVVAKFNQRAIKVYEKAGFVQTAEFTSRIQSQEVTFLCMMMEQYDSGHSLLPR